MLYRSTDRRCHRGARVKNLAHIASLDSQDKNAPSKPGIKHLVGAYRRSATQNLRDLVQTSVKIRAFEWNPIVVRWDWTAIARNCHADISQTSRHL